MKGMKSIIGIALIVTAVGGFLFWELIGRDALFLEEIVVANRDYQPGEVITQEGVSVVGIPQELVIENAVLPDEIHLLPGLMVKQQIPARSQMTFDFTKEDEGLHLKEDESIYTIDAQWIEMKSSSLRRGDVIKILSGDKLSVIGTYTIAFVKDKEDREVKNSSILTYDHPLERENSTGIISKIEIISTLQGYLAIKSAAAESGDKLLLVQKMN